MSADRRDGRTRRGNAALVVVTLAAAIGFGALSVDVGLVWLARLELQQAVDAAAQSGTSELDGTADGVVRAEATAAAVAAAHTVLGAPLELASAARTQGPQPPLGGATAVQVGTYDAVSGTFTPWVQGTDPGLVNAVQVERGDHPVPIGLGALFGASSYQVEARTRTQRRLGAHKAGSVRCFLPIAIPDCHLNGLAPGTNPAPFTFTFSPTPTDAVAWADPAANPNASDTRSHLEGRCEASPVDVGSSLFVNEGSLTVDLQVIRDILNETGAVAPTTWDPSAYGPLPPRGCVGSACKPSNSDVNNAHYGNVLEGPVFLVEAGDDCGAVSFGQSKVVTGIAWGVIYDVRATGGTKYLKIQLDVKNEHRAWGEAAGDPDTRTNVLVPSDPETLPW